ncbi:MAG: hypothetical protein U0836_26915 [Pirellulales bacterium]
MVVLWVLFAIWLAISVEQGRDVTASEANDRIHQAFHLPATASHVNFSTNVRASRVTFAISEADLARWCREDGWTLVPLGNESRPGFIEMQGDGKWLCKRVVEQGLEFRKFDGAFWGVYDPSLGRAYVLFVGD